MKNGDSGSSSHRICSVTAGSSSDVHPDNSFGRCGSFCTSVLLFVSRVLQHINQRLKQLQVTGHHRHAHMFQTHVPNNNPCLCMGTLKGSTKGWDSLRAVRPWRSLLPCYRSWPYGTHTDCGGSQPPVSHLSPGDPEPASPLGSLVKKSIIPLTHSVLSLWCPYVHCSPAPPSPFWFIHTHIHTHQLHKTMCCGPRVGGGQLPWWRSMLIGFLPPVIQLRRQERERECWWAVGVRGSGGVRGLRGGGGAGEMPWRSGMSPASRCCFRSLTTSPLLHAAVTAYSLCKVLHSKWHSSVDSNRDFMLVAACCRCFLLRCATSNSIFLATFLQKGF